VQNIVRKSSILVLLISGGYLIETHKTFYHTCLGIACWAFGIILFSHFIKAVPGIKLFSSSHLSGLKGTKEWGTIPLFLLSLAIVLLLGLSDFSVENRYWLGAGTTMAAMSFLFFILENRSPISEAGPSRSKPVPWHEKIFLPEILILAVGAFFMFSAFPLKSLSQLFSTGGDCDYSFRLTVFHTGVAETEYTTPFSSVWANGFCAFPFFWEAFFLRIFGISQYKDMIFNGCLNLIGLIFFYKFLCFYVSKRASLAATLLLAASHWGVYYVRQTYVGMEFVVPLTAATLYFFARSVESGKARDFALFGTLIGCDLMSHLTIHMYFLYFALVLFLTAVSRRADILKQKKSWFFAFGICALWYLPMFIYFQLHGTKVGFLDTSLFKYYGVWNGQGEFPWGGISNALQMFTAPTQCAEMSHLPYLSPWEGLLFFCGIAWCLWRFYQPAFFILFLGFAAGILPDAVTGGHDEPHRAFAALPFTYLFIGIGIDRLEKVLQAPLGKQKGVWIGTLFLAVFVLFSLGWQYDVLFNQFSRNKIIHANENDSLNEKIAKQYADGWNTYYELGPGNCQVKTITLPLRSNSPKGAAILLDDKSGLSFEGWLHDYYPLSPEKIIYNSLGDVQFRLWEISPDQIQTALRNNKPFPSTGLILTWYDARQKSLGLWHIPTLSTDALGKEWFQYHPGNPAFPWEKVSYFVVSGYWQNSGGQTLTVETTGKVQGTVGGKALSLNGAGELARLQFTSSQKGWVPVKLTYFPKGIGFNLSLYENNVTGRDLISSDQLRTTLQHQP